VDHDQRPAVRSNGARRGFFVFRQLGGEREMKKTVTVGVSLRRETLKLVDRAAQEENRSRSSLIDVAAKAYAFSVLKSSRKATDGSSTGQ